jgi:hypothetical protein
VHAVLGAGDASRAFFSSKPLSSVIVVSSVQARSPAGVAFSRRWPRPRATRVSKVNQASTMPSASVASPSRAKWDAAVSAARAASMSAMAAGPSWVRTFQVKATRSRQ